MDLRSSFLLLCFLTASLFAQEERPVSAMFRGGASTPKPNAELPLHIRKKATQDLALIADETVDAEKGILVYLVNSGEKTISFPSQDGDLYMKLEIKNEARQWRRAQAHLSSGCGNSYGVRELNPGHHFLLRGYQPKSGKKAKVRFHISEFGLRTEELDGLFSDRDLADAAIDVMATRGVPSIITSPFYYPSSWDVEGFTRLMNDPRRRKEFQRALTLWKQYGAVPRIHVYAGKFVKQLEEVVALEPVLKPLYDETKGLYDAPFHPEASAEQLAQFCMSQINESEGSDLLPLWSALADLCREDALPRTSQIMVFEAAKNQEVPYYLFDMEQKVDDFFTTDRLWRILDRSKTPQFRNVIWKSLLRRGQKEQVLNRKDQLSAEDRSQILRLLNWENRTYYRFSSPAEKELWRAEMIAKPLETSFALGNRSSLRANDHPFAFLYQEIRGFWLEQLEKSEKAQEDFAVDGLRNYWLSSLSFLESVEPEFDAELWRRLAKYRGYTVEEFSRGSGGASVDVIEHRYYVRAKAVELLKKHGHAVGEALPEKKVISEIPRE